MSDQMDKSLDEKLLKSLKSVETPAPSQFAKQKALGLAMEEFDAEFDKKLEINKKNFKLDPRNWGGEASYVHYQLD